MRETWCSTRFWVVGVGSSRVVRGREVGSCEPKRRSYFRLERVLVTHFGPTRTIPHRCGFYQAPLTIRHTQNRLAARPCASTHVEIHFASFASWYREPLRQTCIIISCQRPPDRPPCQLRSPLAFSYRRHPRVGPIPVPFTYRISNDTTARQRRYSLEVVRCDFQQPGGFNFHNLPAGTPLVSRLSLAHLHLSRTLTA